MSSTQTSLVKDGGCSRTASSSDSVRDLESGIRKAMLLNVALAHLQSFKLFPIVASLAQKLGVARVV